MEIEATAGACPAPPRPVHQRLVRALRALGLPAVVMGAALLAWSVRRDPPYSAGSETGYWLGVVGGTLMLALLIYPLRKRFRRLAFLGPLKYWFRFHLVGGIAGPLIVLFHATFRVGSFNAAVALASMLLVVASGLVGRYLYRQVHHGLSGSRATAAELQDALARQMTALQPVLAGLPALASEVSRFSALVSSPPPARRGRAVHFVSLGWQRHLAARRIGHAIAGHERERGGEAAAHLRALTATLDEALQAAQRAAQFSTYERLFALWHVIHIPFLCMLVVTAIVHVVAVHAY